MQLTLVRGTGKCIECGNTTSYQMWVGKMQFYFCDKCVHNLYHKSYDFLIKQNEYFKAKQMENQAKELIKRGTVKE